MLHIPFYFSSADFPEVGFVSYRYRIMSMTKRTLNRKHWYVPFPELLWPRFRICLCSIVGSALVDL